MSTLLSTDDRGLACDAGGFWIDPWNPTPVAVVSHAHSDHARPGSGVYYSSREGEAALRLRIGPGAPIRSLEWGEPIDFGPVRVSLHPAAHIRGAAQIRVEHSGETWVFSGDYKRAADPTATPFEVVACDTFITECTFALPIYRWRPAPDVVRDILAWWRAGAAAGSASVLMCYALGKAQRVLAELGALAASGAALPGRVVLHGAVASLVDAYRAAGVRLPETSIVAEDAPRTRRADLAGVLALAPPSAGGTPWMRRFGAPSRFQTAFASGWMQVRGVRRRRGYDRGFVLSDHADWPDLLRTIRDTGARRVLCTHGSAEPLARYLRENGTDAQPLQTPYEGETD